MTAGMSAAVEALLLLATEPMPALELAEALQVPVDEVEECLAELAAFYDSTGRGFELRQVGRGWRYYTRPEHAELIGRWLLEGQRGTLSQAALETLAVVAYLQPISRGRISAIRGVNVDGVLRTLTTRDLIEEAGRDPETGARLFGTTSYFLERIGLTELSQLPPLAPHLPDASSLEAELSELAASAPVESEGGSDE
ncbi:condensin subunit ScpB [Propionicimonas paludicola]|uniref:Condensin subunit ScpB n=1 Tax=Propionicimonas paludicola TaxID=185243 RepID=A0A2A9CQA2_9ACTN|nr:SMC-Scp complex subunit ScpB [Propionicimonas paludicola]PFG16518.1 condensin subunit ScpB [Propionicimonas paludicola]